MAAEEVRIGLFGRPTIVVGDGLVSLSPMQWSLVGLVYGDPARKHGRHSLAATLWTDGTETALRKRLSQVLYEVEQRVGFGVFLKSAASVRPDPAVSTDLDAFTEAIRFESLGVAAQLLSQGFLSGLPDIPTPAYDRWLDQRTAGLRAELRKRATERWVRAEDESLWNQRTRDAAEALVYLDPQSESALRRSIWAQAMCGAPLEALATVASFVEINGLGGADDLEDETCELVGRVRALTRHRRSTHLERPGPSRADPTLFGREAEVAALLPIVAEQATDGMTVVAVSGEAGLGKTRLVRECLEPAMLQGRVVLQTTLSELERDIPLNALIEAMSTQDIARALVALDEPWRTVILNLMPRYAGVVGKPGRLPYVQPASLQRRLLESVRLLVDEVVRDQPVLMFIDDFQWADDSSLAALEYMRRRWSVGSLVLVVACRPEHVVTGSPLAGFLRADSVHHVQLGPIGEVAQKRLLREVAGGDVPTGVGDSLRDLGRGNPLFLIELARQWSEGELDLPRRAIEPIQLPNTIQQLFAQRLLKLDGLATRVLEALSVLAKRVPVEVLRTVSSLDKSEVTNGLEPLDRAGLLRWSADGVEIWHGLVQQAVLGRTSEARLRALHGAVARYLIEDGRADPDEIALHFDRARLRDQAFRYALEAADQAEEVGAVPEALFFLQVCERNAGTSARHSIVQRLASLHYRQCDYTSALACIRELLGERFGPMPPEATSLLRVQEFDCRTRLGRSETSQDYLAQLRRLRRQLTQQGAWEGLARLVRVGVDYLARTDQVDLVSLLLGDVATCLQSRDPRVRCVAHQAGVLLRLYDRNVNGGRAHGEKALELARVHRLSDLLPGALLARLVNLHLDGELELATGLKLRSEALAKAKLVGDLHSHLKLTTNLAAFYLDVGDQERARSFLAASSSLLSGVELGAGGAPIHLNCADLAIQQGEFDKAETIANCVLAIASSERWYGWSVVFAILGRCALETGRLGLAIEYSEQLAEAWPELSTPFLDFGMVTVFRARLLAARNRLGDALELLSHVEKELDGFNVPQFLRIRHSRARLMLRRDKRAAAALAANGVDRCKALGLDALGSRFQRAYLNATH